MNPVARRLTRAIYLGPWRIDVTMRAGISTPVAVAALGRAMARAAEAGGAPRPASIGLILSNDAELAALNEAHMAKQGPTDVLSFPLLPPEAYPAHPGRGTQSGTTRRQAFVLPPRARQHLGDVVVSVERAIDQAAAGRGGQTGDVRWAGADELRLLVTHGTLHLCGWDHADPDEETALRALESRLLRPPV